jgi:acetylornithine deacetylase/succinyl-diaminopimelate desuccinylase-like protein
MRNLIVVWLFLLTSTAIAQNQSNLRDHARQYLIDLLRLDTTSPPGKETRVAEYLKRVADANGIASELLGKDPERLNFVARLRGSGKQRPLLLMAHSDVVPVDRSQWSVDPFASEIRNGSIYGRGAEDDKSLLAAELAVLVELKRQGVKLKCDVILLSESDEEGGADRVGMEWLMQNVYDKIDAEFALNEFAAQIETASGYRIFQIQTTEKIPTRVTLTARGTAGHGSLPRPDNPIAHLATAITRLVEADQPVRLNETTRQYFRGMSKLSDYAWLNPLLPKLENPDFATAATREIRSRDREFDAMLHTTVSPTIVQAGTKINVIPNRAKAQFDIRRLPNETPEEVLARFRGIINDPAVEISPLGLARPPTEPSSLTTPLYRAMERVFLKTSPRSVVVPLMMRGATDGAYLREKGVPVYGVPLFTYENNESRAHGNDERISVASLEGGADLLWQIVLAVAEEQ